MSLTASNIILGATATPGMMAIACNLALAAAMWIVALSVVALRDAFRGPIGSRRKEKKPGKRAWFIGMLRGTRVCEKDQEYDFVCTIAASPVFQKLVWTFTQRSSQRLGISNQEMTSVHRKQE